MARYILSRSVGALAKRDSSTKPLTPTCGRSNCDPRMRSRISILAWPIENLGRVEEEIEEYRKALEIAPDYREALINLAMAYSRSGHGESAVEKWKQVSTASPTA